MGFGHDESLARTVAKTRCGGGPGCGGGVVGWGGGY